MNKKNSIVNIWRIISTLIIMLHHVRHTGFSQEIVSGGWLFVEFFLILTGYLTAKHFSTVENVDINTSFRFAMNYSIKKFKPIVKCTFVAVIVEYMLLYISNYGITIDKAGIVNGFCNLPQDVLCVLTENRAPAVVPLWYIYALIFLFPMICVALIKLNNQGLIVFGVPLVVLYFGKYGVGDYFMFPLSVLRVFVGVIFGTIVYSLSEEYFKTFIESINKKVKLFIIIICVVYPVYCCFNTWNVLRFSIVISFAIGISLAMSEESLYKENIIISYLGDISLPMYVFHWVVAEFLKMWCKGSDVELLIYYLLITLLVALVYMVLNRRVSLKNCAKY